MHQLLELVRKARWSRPGQWSWYIQDRAQSQGLQTPHLVYWMLETERPAYVAAAIMAVNTQGE